MGFILEILFGLLLAGGVITGWVWVIVKAVQNEHPFLAFFVAVTGVLIAAFIACL